MNCLSVSSLDALESPFAWLRPSALGVSIKGADETKLRSISSYLSLLGSRFFLTSRTTALRQDGMREIREVPASPSDAGYFPGLAWKLTFHKSNSDKLVFRPADLDDSFFADARLLADSHWRTDLLNIQSEPIPVCQCECGENTRAATP